MELTPKFDVLIPGGYFCDIIFTGLKEFPQLGTEIYSERVDVMPGGGALSTTIALQRLGLRAGWIGMLGTDFFSHFITHVMEREKLDQTLVKQLDQPLQRVTVALSYPQDRAFVTYVDPLERDLPAIYEALERVEFRHLHFAGLVVDEKVPALVDACHAKGISVSMDCQYRSETLSVPLIREILGKIDVFIPNESEALRLTETDNLPTALDRLSAAVSYLVVKQGPQGSTARRGNTQVHCPAIPTKVVDTTGAGDVFDAGFIAAYLNGKDMAECLKWGNICGGLSVRAAGGSTTAPTLSQLSEYLDAPR